LGLVVAGFRAAVFLLEGLFFGAFFELDETRLIVPRAGVRFFLTVFRFLDAGFT
jgi:hypothetical protein